MLKKLWLNLQLFAEGGDGGDGSPTSTTGEQGVDNTGEIYEYQLSEVTKMCETHIENIRAHYEQHRQDFKENVEKRFADKREIIAQQEEHIKTLKKENLMSKTFTIICVVVLVGLLIAEVMNPNLGWLRY